MTSNTLALVSVISSGAVALVAGFAPIAFQWLKWHHERITADRESIAGPARELLRSLAEVQAVGNTNGMSINNPLESCTSLLASYYRWEYAVWPRLTSDEQPKVVQVRESLTRYLTPDHHLDNTKLAELLTLTGTKIAAEIIGVTRLAEH